MWAEEWRCDSPDSGLRVWVEPCGPQGCALLYAGSSFGEALDRLTPESFPYLSQVRTLQWNFPSFWYFIQTRCPESQKGALCEGKAEKETVILSCSKDHTALSLFEYTDVSLGSIMLLSYGFSPWHTRAFLMWEHACSQLLGHSNNSLSF